MVYVDGCGSHLPIKYIQYYIKRPSEEAGVFTSRVVEDVQPWWSSSIAMIGVYGRVVTMLLLLLLAVEEEACEVVVTYTVHWTGSGTNV